MNTPTLSNRTQQDLLDRMPVDESTAVVAGHYCLADHMSELSNTCSAEFMSFQAGLALAQQAKERGKPCALVLWINDVGIAPGTRTTLKQNYKLPENYHEALRTAGMKPRDLTVMFESTARNKASTLLRRFYKRKPQLFEKVDAGTDGLKRCINSAFCVTPGTTDKFAYVIDGPDNSKLVVKEGSNPKCNLILATFFNSLKNKFSLGFQINIFNQVYVHRLALGIHVSRRLFDNPTPMVNLFCDGEALSMAAAPDHKQDFRPFHMTTESNGRSLVN